MKKTIISLLLIITCAGCNDFLEVDPKEATSVKEQFSTINGHLQALNGAYYKTEGLVGGVFFIYADIQGGNLTFSPIRSGTNIGRSTVPDNYLDIYNFDDTALNSSFKIFYSESYAVINNINNILFFIDNLPEGSQQQKDQVKAEALALRAFVHFNLLQVYAQNPSFSANALHKGIVYNRKPIQGGIDFPARQPVSECYQLLINDLQEALQLFTTKQALNGPSYSFFNTITTKAFLARAALQGRYWELARTMASEVINTSGINLTTTSTYVSEWEKPTAPVNEVLLEFTAPLSSDGSVISSSVSQYYKFIRGSNGLIVDYGRYVGSGDLMDLFQDTDVRKQAFIETSLNVLSENNAQMRDFFFTKKFQDNPGTTIIRLSEMYLILAEANARLDNKNEALTALNKIRIRANIAEITNTDQLLEDIFLERRRELCFEGHLFFDLVRFNKNITRTSGCSSLNCNLNYPNPKFILPLPQTTINVNENMEQNESY